jgi:hypothetical protein
MPDTGVLHPAASACSRAHPAAGGASAIQALLAGAGLLVLSGAGFMLTGYNWASGGYVALPSALPITLAAALGAIGCQTFMGGFLLAIIAGHKAQIVARSFQAEPVIAPPLVRDIAA